MKRRPVLRVAVVVTIAVIIGGGFYAWRLFDLATAGMADSYAAMQTGYRLADHLAEHEGTWPSGWDALGVEVIRDLERSFPDVRDRVRVRWTVDPELLRSARSLDQPPFPLVWLDSGAPAGPTEHHNANRVILQVLEDLREQDHPTSENDGDSDKI